MSATHSDSHSTTPNPNPKRAGLGASIAIIVFFICIALAKGIFSSGAKDIKDDNSTLSTSSSQPVVRYAPPHEAIHVDINGTLSKKIDIPVDYYLRFICDHDYQVVDDEGNSHDGLAHQDVAIGVVHLSESARNLTLRFKTRDSSNTTMKVELIPMEIKN
jgi:hypothetical protein